MHFPPLMWMAAEYTVTTLPTTICVICRTVITGAIMLASLRSRHAIAQ